MSQLWPTCCTASDFIRYFQVRIGQISVERRTWITSIFDNKYGFKYGNITVVQSLIRCNEINFFSAYLKWHIWISQKFGQPYFKCMFFLFMKKQIFFANNKLKILFSFFPCDSHIFHHIRQASISSCIKSTEKNTMFSYSIGQKAKSIHQPWKFHAVERNAISINFINYSKTLFLKILNPNATLMVTSNRNLLKVMIKWHFCNLNFIFFLRWFLTVYGRNLKHLVEKITCPNL